MISGGRGRALRVKYPLRCCHVRQFAEASIKEKVELFLDVNCLMKKRNGKTRI